MNIGAILAAINFEYCDSLEHGNDEENRVDLDSWWGITSSETAIETLDWLKNEGHRKSYDHILSNASDAFSENPSGDYDDETVYNLMESLPGLYKHKIVGDSLDFLASISTTAWDMGRMVNVSRWCYDYGYISKTQAWEYIFCAQNESRLFYNDWREFSSAYIIGRAMWSGEDGRSKNMMTIVRKLLKYRYSPWVVLPLK